MAEDRFEASFIFEVIVGELTEDIDFINNTGVNTGVNCAHIVASNIGAAAAIKTSEPSVRITNYYESIIPAYSDKDFKAHFRMYRDTFEELCVWLSRPLSKERRIPLEKKILATLWHLGNKESFRSIADRFNMSKGTLHYVILSVCNSLVSQRGECIKWPEIDELRKISDDFSERCGFPGVVGAIDGTHIEIPGPKKHRDAYINRNGYPSMQLQVVCNKNLSFLDAYTGWPGSVHDCRVFKNSPLMTKLEDSTFPSKYHLIGDSAYQLTNYMLVPFRDNGHLTSVEKTYNKKHSATRVEVERSIGLLKGKFRRLKYLEMFQINDIPSVIIAACVLHNFIIEKSGVHEEDIEVGEQSTQQEISDSQDIQTGVTKRIDIANLLL